MSVKSFEHIRIVERDETARLTLSTPDIPRGLNRAMLREVIEVLDDILFRRRATSVLVISSECLEVSPEADVGNGGFDLDASELLKQLDRKMVTLPIPIIASVSTPVVGAACMIVLSADIILASRSAYFVEGSVHRGLIPDDGVMWMLPRLVGRARAQAMMLLGEGISADMAYRWDSIYEIVDDANLMARTNATITKLLTVPTQDYTVIRRASRATLD